MTIKQWLLSGLTLLVVFLISLSLLNSLAKPQIQGQLELYQTNLILQASEWQGLAAETKNADQARNAIIGADPVASALSRYQKAQSSAQTTLNRLEQTPNQQLAPTPPKTEVDPELGRPLVRPSSEQKLRRVIDEYDLRLGILYTRSNQPDLAVAAWQGLINQPTSLDAQQQIATAKVLNGLWSQPPQLLPDAEAQLQKHLSGWFQYQALTKLYQLQQRQDALLALQQVEQQTAQDALVRITLVGLIPVLSSLIGVILIVTWLGRLILGRSRPEQRTSRPDQPGPDQVSWSVPWPGETIWQVMVLWFTGFFGVSLILVPLVVRFLGLNPLAFGPRTQALFALFSYGTLMATGFSILYLCLKPFLPRPTKWLPIRWQGRWFWWGVGGYLASLPLVIVISLVNQQLLNEQGGANPILDIILQSKDNLTIALLLLMVAVLAPVFEETLFRGFFLTSLTRYLPTWGAIIASAVLFAVAHLNISDLLPLTALGMVLGFVYTRSRNLLASMLLHGIWNSGSLIGLLVLSGGST